VAVGAALPGDEAQQQALVHPDRLRGGQVVRHKDTGLGALQAGVVHPLQNVQHGLRDVDDIGAAGLQIGVVHGGKHGGLVVACRLDGILGAAALAVDDLLDGVHEVVIIQHHGVDVEHFGDVLACLGKGFLVQGGLLVDGLGPGVLKTLDLRGGVGHFGRRDGRILFLVEFQLANGNAVQNAFTGTHLHRSFLLITQISCVWERKSPRSLPRGLLITTLHAIRRSRSGTSGSPLRQRPHRRPPP
jgi:hypothetical protein